jgi:hypothetical protein
VAIRAPTCRAIELGEASTPTSAATSTTPAFNPESRRRNHTRQLEALGYKVILERAA